MKVLWVCNISLPKFAISMGEKPNSFGGWMSQTLDLLSSKEDIEIGVCFPYANSNGLIYKEIEGVKYWGFNKKNWDPAFYDKTVEKYFKSIIADYNPDILHIFGSEFPHALAAAKVFAKPKHTVLHIQGLSFFLGEKYQSFLPEKVFNSYTFRDFVRHDNLKLQKEKFIKRGFYEIELLKYINNVMGRTNWDRAASFKINPLLNYYYIPENLREEFNKCEKWVLKSCERYTAFISQGTYPIKGLHLALEAFSMVVREFPNAKLYVAGNDITDISSFRKKITQGSYSKYICSLIKKYNLSSNVKFVGNLSASEMIDYYKKCNVFISASTIENSPNSVMEAMKVGIPVISSDVGGVSSLLTNGLEGILYPADETYVLGYNIIQIFKDEDLALKLSKNSIKRMDSISVNNNIELLCNAYRNIFDL